MNKKIIISLVNLLISLALIFIFIFPIFSSVRTLRQEIAQEKLKVVKVEELLDRTRQLDEELKEVGKESQKIFLALPKEKDIPNLLIQFETLALNNGLLLEKVGFGSMTEETEKTAGPKFQELPLEESSPSLQEISQSAQEPPPSKSKLTLRSLPVDLVIQGSYSAFKKYLTDLEKSVRSMDVYSIGLSTEGEDKETSLLTSSLGIFEFKLGLNVYYQ